MVRYSSINGRKIRIGVIGCGRISKKHFDAIEQFRNDLELVAVCDVNSRICAEYSKIYSVPAYKDISELLKKEAVDVVVLCTPSGLHPEQAIIAAEFSVNVITEKPMATCWEDGVRMVSACEGAGVRLFVVKQNRWNSTLQLLKRALVENRFGKIHLAQINVFWTRPQSYYDQGSWRGTWKLDGGAFMNQASHYVDLLHWLLGPVEELHAMTSTTRNIEAEDTGVLNIKWLGGALGSMSVTMLAYPQNIEGSITIMGETGSARIGGVAVNQVQLWSFSKVRDYDKNIMDVNYEPSSIYGHGHSRYYEDVIDVLRGKKSPETDGREGLKTLELLCAAYLSARDKRSITLPMEST
jgi:UDP-N-acetyl-2-amino-2-deoxyglucuronate dehydrogenase